MKILVINPGATSTKIAVFDEDQQLYKLGLDHSAEELNQFDRVIDQADYRKAAILDAITAAGYKLEDFDAVCGRGGLYRPIPSGTYAVNDKVMHDVETAPYGEHPSNLGAYLAKKLGDMVGIPAFFVDPVCVDEMTEVAHYTGFAEFRRLCQFHALNHKSIGRKAAQELGKAYEDVNLIVCHLGGGVSVGAHRHGRVVDVCNVKDEGSMGMDRAGGLPVNQLIDYCFSGKTKDEVKKDAGPPGRYALLCGYHRLPRGLRQNGGGRRQGRRGLSGAGLPAGQGHRRHGRRAAFRCGRHRLHRRHGLWRNVLRRHHRLCGQDRQGDPPAR